MPNLAKCYTFINRIPGFRKFLIYFCVYLPTALHHVQLLNNLARSLIIVCQRGCSAASFVDGNCYSAGKSYKLLHSFLVRPSYPFPLPFPTLTLAFSAFTQCCCACVCVRNKIKCALSNEMCICVCVYVGGRSCLVLTFGRTN